MKIADAIKQQADILCQSNQVADVIAILLRYGVYHHPIMSDTGNKFISISSSCNTQYYYLKDDRISTVAELFPLITAGEFIAHNPISEGTKQHPRDHAGRYDN